GIWVEDCGGKAPRISSNTVIAAQGAGGLVPPPRSEGVHAVGDCHPVIDSNLAISGAAEGQTNNAFGVFCGANGAGVASKCEVLGNAAIGGSSGGFPPVSAAVWCQNGGCNRVEGNLLAAGQAGQDAYGLWLQNTGASVDGNRIVGGTCTPRGTGIYAENAFARVTNNQVLGAIPPAPGGTCTRGNQRSLGLQVVNSAGPNEVDVHSNTISGGGTILSTTCVSAGLVLGSGTPDGGQPPAGGGKGTYRNNILRSGECPNRYDVWELDAGADPRVFQNNDLDPYTTGIGSTVLYLDEGGNAINLIGSVNSASDMTASGNVSGDPLFRSYATFDWHLDAGSPCINQGTATGAPALDIDGDPRDATPDIGCDEFK
ncbi:MAG TPA: choice-of-anchor Q domain-containing protein, partial [Myxococcales bacterium]|nr:choice-of-anchor Q domain-containing protein [Myxococcales bacterium]